LQNPGLLRGAIVWWEKPGGHPGSHREEATFPRDYTGHRPFSQSNKSGDNRKAAQRKDAQAHPRRRGAQKRPPAVRYAPKNFYEKRRSNRGGKISSLTGGGAPTGVRA